MNIYPYQSIGVDCFGDSFVQAIVAAMTECNLVVSISYLDYLP